MNKQDTIIVVLLFAALILWFKFQPARPPVQPMPAEVVATEVAESVAVDHLDKDTVQPVSPPVVTPAAVPEPAGEGQEPVVPKFDEQIVTIANTNMLVTLSSWGACVKEVQLLNYRESLDKSSGPVTFDFSDIPALSIGGVPLWGAGADFSVIASSDSNVVMKASAGDVTLTRSIELGEDGYLLMVRDSFEAADGSAVPAYSIQSGSMNNVKSSSAVQGMSYISIDSLPVSGSKVVHWSKRKDITDDGRAKKLTLEDRFQAPPRQGGCGMFKPKMMSILPASVEVKKDESTKWVAVKNQFFLSVLSPAQPSDGVVLMVKREVPETESAQNSATWVQSPVIDAVSARMLFNPGVISAGEPLVREYSCYVGPKKYSELKQMGRSYEDIMEFGFWSPLSRILLSSLTYIHKVVRNYGLAIIVLTVLVRLVFWPVTHKSTESMKRMQAIQPEVKKLQAKFKDNPSKLNQATMALYKEHKVNPMAGCLPLLVQIPVFFALFTVLRSAVELRFAGFLWIKDLSEQEGLLAGVLPIPLNILPLVMTGLTVWQQKMTPSAGDPQQQKMMMFMPIIFLFLFYPMPSALVLYWTTSQSIAILQLLLQRRKRAVVPA